MGREQPIGSGQLMGWGLALASGPPMGWGQTMEGASHGILDIGVVQLQATGSEQPMGGTGHGAGAAHGMRGNPYIQCVRWGHGTGHLGSPCAKAYERPMGPGQPMHDRPWDWGRPQDGDRP